MTIRAHPWTAERLRLASVEITRRCNNRCPYCDQPHAERDMPVADFRAILDRLEAWDAEAVALGGGEPTLHPQLRQLLEAVQRRGLRAGLTTNSRASQQVIDLAEGGLLDRFGVSAGKGTWEALVPHPHAVVNLLLLQGGLSQVLRWATKAIALGAECLLLLSYKGEDSEYICTTEELANAFGLLSVLGRQTDVTVAADAYTLRRLGLARTCGEDFIRFDLEGRADFCCFPSCEYRPTDPRHISSGPSIERRIPLPICQS